MIEKRFCIECGADISNRAPQAVRCIECGIKVHRAQSKQCYYDTKERRAERAIEKRMEKKRELAAHHTHKMTLSECARAAREKGMTYGMYVASTGK